MKINRYLILSITVAGLYIALRFQINNAILKSDLYLWLNKIELDAIGKTIYILLTIIVSIFYIGKIRSKVKSDNRWLWLIGCVFFIYYLDRFIFRFWSYYPHEWEFKYFDLILIVSTCELLNSMIIALSGMDKINVSIFELERPIENPEDDDFKRNIFARRIVDELNNSHFKESFSIGIVGEWSSGKSSFLNLIRSNLNPKDRIILDFKPWLNYDRGSTVKTFFELMKSELSTYDKNLSGLLNQYYQSISSFDSGAFSKVLSTLNPLQESKTQSAEYFEINGALKGIGKQIVIIIDDLDRLDPREIVEVFKLIRNTANFHNTVYITAFDRTYVVHAIRKLSNYNPHRFIDKIFDLEYVLPEIGEEFVIEDLNVFLSNEIKAPKVILKNTESEKIIKQLIVNKRELRRLKHSLKINWVDIAFELNFDEILILEILRHKYPQVLTYFYRDIKVYLDWEDIMPIDKVYTLKTVDYLPVILGALKENEKSNTNRFFLSEDSIADIGSTFEFLFGDRKGSILNPEKMDDQVARNSIRKKNYLDIYFSLIFHDGAIKFNEFIENINLPNDDFLQYADTKLLTSPLGVKPIQLFDLLRKEYVKNLTTTFSHENLVSLLLLIEGKGIAVPIDLFSEFYSLTNDSLRNFYNQDQLSLDFHRLFKERKFTHHARCNIINGLILKYLKPSFSIFILSLEDLIALNLWIFTDYLAQQPIVNNDLLSIYYKQYSLNDSSNHVILNAEASKLMVSYVTDKKRVKDYLNLLIRPNPDLEEGNLFVFEPFLKQTFDSFDKFEEFLGSVTQYEHKDTLQSYFSKFKANNFKPFKLSQNEIRAASADFVNMFPYGRPRAI